MATGRKSDFTLPTFDSIFSTQEQRDDAKLAKIRDIPISEIDDFPDHPFKVRDDEDMLQLVESIKERGVITPAIAENNASIFVNKELQRVNRDAIEALDSKDVIRIFPKTLSNTHTSLLLKAPKTKTSVRKVFLPNTVAKMLQERKKQIDEMIELFGDEYYDYNLVFCHSSGRPMEGQVINRALKQLIRDNDLPDVVFHSFRHASITYKLKWNGGDMKSVQGDSGHARMDMISNVYSHIIDDDRRFNAQKFEEQFYNTKGLRDVEDGKTAPMPKFESVVEMLDPMAKVVEEQSAESEVKADENMELIAKLLANPETASLLKALAKSL